MAVEGFESEISWSKFKKRKTRPSNSDADGYTKARSKSEFTFGRGSGGAIVVKSADITITMDTEESWVMEDKMTDELLKHEQGHFDITALGVRDLYTGSMKLKAKSPKGLDDSLKKLGKTIQDKIDRTNIRYDKQTRHSQAKTEQEKWNKAISTEKLKKDGSLDNLPQ
jgi:predicted secreted Zn-dependent protease